MSAWQPSATTATPRHTRMSPSALVSFAEQLELTKSDRRRLSCEIKFPHFPYLTKYFPGPCKPLRAGVDFHCGTSTASMYWEEVEGVELYVATATCSRGMSLQCNSTNSTCEFSDLRCGETYVLSVTAYSNMCYSEVSSSVEVQTGKNKQLFWNVKNRDGKNIWIILFLSLLLFFESSQFLE